MLWYWKYNVLNLTCDHSRHVFKGLCIPYQWNTQTICDHLNTFSIYWSITSGYMTYVVSHRNLQNRMIEGSCLKILIKNFPIYRWCFHVLKPWWKRILKAFSISKLLLSHKKIYRQLFTGGYKLSRCFSQ